MQKSLLLGKHLARSNYSPKTTSQVINNNLSDYLVKSKYGKVLQTVYINKTMLFFEFQRGGLNPKPPQVRH